MCSLPDKHIAIGYYRWEKNGEYLLDVYFKVSEFSTIETKYTIPKELLMVFMNEQNRILQKIVTNMLSNMKNRGEQCLKNDY